MNDSGRVSHKQLNDKRALQQYCTSRGEPSNTPPVLIHSFIRCEWYKKCHHSHD